MSDTTAAELRAWLETFAACVRAQDFDAARPMIAEEVVSFGTKAAMVQGRENLIAQQWRHIWPTIQGFTFDLDTLHWHRADDTAWAVLTWTSRGFRPDGTPFPRPGRATFTFIHRDGRWLAIHTHFSLFPLS
jgi:ketosteroid isomerase-like protein